LSIKRPTAKAVNCLDTEAMEKIVFGVIGILYSRLAEPNPFL